MSPTRALAGAVWGRRVARLPARGVLLVATDLQGNLRDYEALEAHYRREEAAGNDPILALCGDLVHGPHPRMLAPGAWPEHLGTPYQDQSAELILRFEHFSREARAFSLLGNHEHAHIGGAVVSKFHPDEAAVLNQALGADGPRIEAFIETFPLLAVAPNGAVLTHGAPAASAPDLDGFEALTYRPRDARDLHHGSGVLGALLWARGASAEQARTLLRATGTDGKPNAFVAYGHDVVWEGYDVVGDEQICVSTSYGLYDPFKTYLRLELTRRYGTVRDLVEGAEIRRLYA